MSARPIVTCHVTVTLPNSVVLATDWIYSGVGPSLPLRPSWSPALGTGHYSDVTGMSRVQARSISALENTHSYQRNNAASLAIWYCRGWERFRRNMYHRVLQFWLPTGGHGILC